MDTSKITIATLGSHSALQILKGAKDEGFKTVLISLEKRLKLYNRFKKLIDELIVVKDFSEVASQEIQEKLLNLNSILIPHGSLIEYTSLETIEKNFRVPIFGNKYIFRWESDRALKDKLLKEAHIRTPKTYETLNEVDRLVMVKLPGAKGGKGYFLASNPESIETKLRDMGLKLEDAFIQEYIIGTTAYIHFFYSPLTDELELISIDKRYETNVDGLGRLSADIQLLLKPETSYLVIGNIPIVLRESLLEEIFEMGDNLVKVSKKLIPPGFIGPFCIEGVYDKDGNFYAFEFSARIVAGTNLYTHGSPYTWLLYDEPVSMGKRIAMEIKKAIQEEKINYIVT